MRSEEREKFLVFSNEKKLKFVHVHKVCIVEYTLISDKDTRRQKTCEKV